MYVRPQGYRYPEGVRLPKNYGGSAFSDQIRNEQLNNEPLNNEQIADSTENFVSTDRAEIPEALSHTEKESTDALLYREEKRGAQSAGLRGLGSEELLLFALILLLSDSEIGDDLVLFLILLFFIK